MPLFNYQFAKKKNNEKDLVKPIVPRGFEVILILLTEPVAMKVLIAIIQIAKSSLKGLLAGCSACLKLAIFLAFIK